MSPSTTTSESPNARDWELVDVLVVGSLSTGEFQPGVSDIDLCVVVDTPKESGVLYGFDAYLMEDRARDIINAAEVAATEVDAGVYTDDQTTNLVEDDRAYQYAGRGKYRCVR